MSQTATQIPPMARVSFSEKESSFIASGVLRSSCLACCTPRWMRPICVAEPVAVTTASPRPFATTVPEKSMQDLSWMRASAATASSSFGTEADSPVSEPSSVESVVVPRETRRASAGTRSPTRTSMMSPGTSSAAGSSCTHSPPRRHLHASGCSCLSASSADAADASCQTPTTALIARMSTITAGSTQPFGSSSSRASTYDSTATPSRIWTSRSSNCAASSCHSGVGFSASSSFRP
mmetsp:Transcript_36652/g.108977  ORF Transcript_36652/g.108977 Transcript_36652/m.108977 type:complete len:236 (+) Transcript_36652:2702-3409(+)